MKKAGFTLIELLVVIAIIAILASLSLPVYTKVMESSRSTQDANNQRQIGTSIVAYLSDNDDQLFTSGSGGGSTTTTTSWMVTLANGSYLTDWKIYQSPFDKRPLTSGTPQNVSYGINTNALGTNIAKWIAPSQTVMISPDVETDATGASEIKFTGNSDADTKVDPPTGGATPLGTHNSRKRINAVFGDAHVQANMSWKDYSDTTSNSGRLWKPFD